MLRTSRSEPAPGGVGTLDDTRMPTGRETVLVAVGQGALMVLGGVLALLVAQLFGKNAKTDAFFAAYGVYAVGLTFGQTFRLTAISRLVDVSGTGRNRTEPTTRLLGAVLVMAVLVSIPMVVFADPIGRVLVTNDPGKVAPQALRIFWIALTGQLLAAMLATVLAVRAAFTAIGVATLLSGLISVAVFLLVRAPLGILGAAVGLTASAAWLTAAFTVVLWRAGWRPSQPTLGSVREMVAEALRLTFASSIFIGSNLAYLICVSVAARQGGGEATLFAYAYTLGAMLVGVTANVSAMVRSPALISGSQRTQTAAALGVWSFRFTLLLAGPVLAMVVLFGKPVLATVLGHGFDGRDVQEILITLVCLVGWIFGWAAGIFAIIELLARWELRMLALIAVVLVLAVLGLGILGGALAGVEGVALALSTATLGTTLLLLRGAFGSDWKVGVNGMLRASVRELLALVGAFVPPAVLLQIVGGSTLGRLAAAALAAVLVTVASRVAWPEEFQALIALARRKERQPPSTRLPDERGAATV